MKQAYYDQTKTAGALLEIYIDDELIEAVDTHHANGGGQALAQQKWFEKLDLEAGEHTLEVKFAGLSEAAKAEGGTKPKLAFDYYEVTPAAPGTPDKELADYSKVEEALIQSSIKKLLLIV